MGYWEPPPPSAFDPAPRPLRYQGSASNPDPSPEDRLLFGIGIEGDAFGLRNTPFAAHVRNLPANPGYARPFLKWYNGKQRLSDSDLIESYKLLIAARAPGDPDRGGLAADYFDGTAVHLNYWDMSDDRKIVRKQVIYQPKGDGISISVLQYGPDEDWHEEGFDAERDFTAALPDILKGLQIVTTALVGAFTGNPALAAAWAALLGIGTKTAITRVSPDVGEVMSTFGAYASESVKLGGKIDLSGILNSNLMRSDFFQGLQGQIGKIRAYAEDAGKAVSFLDTLRATIVKAGQAFPGVDLLALAQHGPNALVPGIVQKDAGVLGISDPTQVIGTISRDIQCAIDCFNLDLGAMRSAGEEYFYSLRKTTADKALFDSTYAACLAQSEKPIDQRMLATQANDSTETVAQVLARGKQSASVASDKSATLTFRQALAQNAGLVPAAIEPPSNALSNAAGLALASLVLYKLFRMVHP